jgi:hypothetical protein
MIIGMVCLKLGDGWGFWGGGFGYSGYHGRGVPVFCAPKV